MAGERPELEERRKYGKDGVTEGAVLEELYVWVVVTERKI